MLRVGLLSVLFIFTVQRSLCGSYISFFLASIPSSCTSAMATAAAPSWASRRAVAPPIPPPPPVMAKTRPLQEWKSNDAMIIIVDNLIQEKELISERKTAVQTLQMLLRACRARGICNITEFSFNIPFGVGLLVHKDPECQKGVGGSAVFVVVSLLRDRPPEQPLSYFGIVFVFPPWERIHHNKGVVLHIYSSISSRCRLSVAVQ